MGGDDTAAKRALPKLKTLKLKLCPNLLQKQKLEQWAGCSRFTYNKAVATSLTKGSTQKNAYNIRDRIVTLKKRGSDTTNSFFDNKTWLLDCPKAIRFNAVDTAVSNIKSCFSNFKAGNIERFSAPFKTKKNQILKGWTMGMDLNNVTRDEKKLYVFKDLLGEMKYNSTKQLRKLFPGINPSHDPKIQKSALGEYFLVLSLDWSKRERNTVSLNIKVNEDGSVSSSIKVNHNTSIYEGFSSAAFDPGIRKTLTSFSPENKESFVFGKGHATQMTALLFAYDKLLSETSKKDSTMNSNERRGAKISMLRIRKRIFYLKKEFRDQVSNFVARRYDILLVPKLKTAEMSLRTGRRLKTKVVRQMMTLGHSLLHERMREKCLEYGSTFMEVKEHYTSQTCPKCGNLKKTSSETYCCDKCGFQCDRDVMGALNIYLKSLRKTKPCGCKCKNTTGELTPKVSRRSTQSKNLSNTKPPSTSRAS
jgi:transposase